MSQSIQPKFLNFSSNFYVNQKQLKHIAGTFQWILLPSNLSKEASLAIQILSKHIFVLGLTKMCRTFHMVGKRGIAILYHPQKIPQDSYEHRDNFPWQRTLSTSSIYIIVSIYALTEELFSCGGHPMVTCIYFRILIKNCYIDQFQLYYQTTQNST